MRVACPSPLAVEAGRQQAPDRQLRAVGVGAGHDDGELVATDAERPVGSAQVGRDGRGGLAQEPVADRVTARVVDPLEVVEVEDRERQRLTVPDRPIAHCRSISSWNARWLPRPVSVSRSASARARS